MLRTGLVQPQRNLDFGLSTGKIVDTGGKGPTGKPNGNEPDDLIDPDDGKGDDDNIIQPDATAVSLGGHTFDANGNLLDDKGATIKTKDELANDNNNNNNHNPDDDPDDNDDNSVIGALQTKFGKVEGKQFKNTSEDLFNYLDEIAPKLKEEGFLEKLEEEPLVKQFYEHVKKGGSVDTFKRSVNRIDFTQIKLEDKPENVEIQEKVYRAALKAKGTDEEEIEELVNTAKDKSTLLKRSQSSLQFLEAKQDAEISAEIEKEQALRQKQLDDEVAIENEVKQTLTKGVVLGIPIPKEDLKKLNDYIYKPVDKKGNTQRDIDRSKLTVQESLFFDYLRMNNFKVKGLTPPKKLMELEDMNKDTNKNKRPDMSNTGGGKGGNKVNLGSLNLLPGQQ
jgi:hypothetical protein